MIVSPQEYESLLFKIRNPNEYISMIQIPADEPMYEIDLNQRIIHAPEFLSVETDHNAEIIWFKMDRFYDNIDLSTANCWIQYINANKEEFYCAAPLIIAADTLGPDYLLIPWVISNEVAKKSGTISFSFQFFELSEDKLQFLYRINTQLAKSKILTGLIADPLEILGEANKPNSKFQAQAELLANKLDQLQADYNRLSGQYILYWNDAK